LRASRRRPADYRRGFGQQPGQDRRRGFAEDRRSFGARVRRRGGGLAQGRIMSGTRDWRGLLFVAPFVLLYGLILVFPLLRGLWLSLNQVDLFGAGHFVGAGNYVRLFHDTIFGTSLVNTFDVALMIVPALTVISLLLALALNRATAGAAILRGI